MIHNKEASTSSTSTGEAIDILSKITQPKIAQQERAGVGGVGGVGGVDDEGDDYEDDEYEKYIDTMIRDGSRDDLFKIRALQHDNMILDAALELGIVSDEEYKIIFTGIKEDARAIVEPSITDEVKRIRSKYISTTCDG